MADKNNDDVIDEVNDGSFDDSADDDILEPGSFKPLTTDKDSEEVLDLSTDKVNAEQLRDAMLRRKAAAQQRRQEAAARRNPVFSLARIGFTALAIVGAVGMSLYTLGTAGTFDKQSQANATKINSLKDDLQNVNSSHKTKFDNATLVNSLEQAKVAAKAVSDIQNDMATTRLSADTDKFETETRLNKYVAQVNDAKKYISKNAQTNGTFEPQQRWVAPMKTIEVVDEEMERIRPGLAQAREKKLIPLDPGEFNWTSHGTFSIDPATGKVPVVWSAQYNNEIISWVTADFDATVGTFSNFEKGLTPAGQRLMEYGTPSVEQGKENEARDALIDLEKELKKQLTAQNNRDDAQQRDARAGKVTSAPTPSSAKPSSSSTPTSSPRLSTVTSEPARSDSDTSDHNNNEPDTQ